VNQSYCSRASLFIYLIDLRFISLFDFFDFFDLSLMAIGNWQLAMSKWHEKN
jgi:hypothetical protein